MSAGTRLQVRAGVGLLMCTLLGTLVLSGCKSSAKAPTAEQAWAKLRDAKESNDADKVSTWLLAEMLRPGGKPAGVVQARKRLDQLGTKGVIASLARGIDDEAHGRVKAAAEHFFDALIQASRWDDPQAGLYAWYAALRAQELAPTVTDFAGKHRSAIDQLIKEPGHIGFRAYGLVVEFWAEDAFTKAEKDIDERLADKLGCVSDVTLAGPFGTNPRTDILRPFAPEQPGFWPAHFEREPGQHDLPGQLPVDATGCAVVVDEPVSDGVFYAQSFIELTQPRTLILSAGGSTQLWVNDVQVQNRDVRVWGSWPRIATQVTLPKGRHRLVWKTHEAQTSLRIMEADGRPAALKTSSDQYAGYSLVPPSLSQDPNELSPFFDNVASARETSDLTRFVAAYLADDDGASDIAAVLFEPLVEDVATATGVALSTAAIFVAADPIYDQSQTRDLVHELQVRAVEHDSGLWFPTYQNIVWDAEQKGATTVVGELEKLAKSFPDVPSIPFSLAELYEELGWGPEYDAAVLSLLAHFPEDEDALRLGIEYHEEAGNFKKVDELLERIVQAHPDSELRLTRALNRRDYKAALAELKRLLARRPGRKDIEGRIEELLIASGDQERTLEQLKNALDREPRDAHARLALADAYLAKGNDRALTTALVESISAGADPSPIEGAIDLVEGITALEPYRLDGKKVIAEYEARNHHMPGTAARVLDYGAVWINPDGSSRFLEHEIVRIQSEEAINRFTEESGHGLVLRLRVIKKDGTTLEPEEVAGKPTVTMPHLEVGDYIETERIVSRWGDGVGEMYEGPGWFFREKDVAYARSEFVVIAPLDKELVLEPHNGVPEPQVTKTGSIVVYRYRVDDSPAAAVEPMSPPAQEFLPRVSIGWGLSFKERLQSISRSMINLEAVDPRLVKIAQNITKKAKTDTERARALYHWILDSVQDGEEQDGRRVVVSRNGNRLRGFETLCRAAGIEVRWALAESKLASPIFGPIDSATRPLTPLLVVTLDDQPHFLTIEDKFAPFGTVPSYLRGAPAYLLGKLEAEETRVPDTGIRDGIAYEGEGQLSESGDLKLDLKIIFHGSFAASLRNGLSQIPENQLGNVIESRLLAQQLQGAQLISHRVINKDNLDQPLTISIKTEVPHFATETAVGMLVSPPFMPRLSQFTTLASRVTPLLIGQQTEQHVDLLIALPASLSAHVPKENTSSEAKKSPHAEYTVTDEVKPGSLRITRTITTRAGRVVPEAYAEFQRFTNTADAALTSSIRLKRGQ